MMRNTVHLCGYLAGGLLLSGDTCSTGLEALKLRMFTAKGSVRHEAALENHTVEKPPITQWSYNKDWKNLLSQCEVNRLQKVLRNAKKAHMITCLTQSEDRCEASKKEKVQAEKDLAQAKEDLATANKKVLDDVLKRLREFVDHMPSFDTWDQDFLMRDPAGAELAGQGGFHSQAEVIAMARARCEQAKFTISSLSKSFKRLDPVAMFDILRETCNYPRWFKESVNDILQEHYQILFSGIRSQGTLD